MAEVEITRNEVEDPGFARQLENEIAEAAATAADPERMLACTILDEGLHIEIEVEVPGWVERIVVPQGAARGTVCRAVRHVLQEAGLTLA